MTQLLDIRDVKDLAGKRVLVRASLDVSFRYGEIPEHDYRLDLALDTLVFLQRRSARTIVVGHVGRDPSQTLEPVFEYLKRHLDLSFVPETVGPSAQKAIDDIKDGEVILLENLRREKGEVENDLPFAQDLASLGDIYVNDAFSVSHRRHASIVGVPTLLPSYAGVQFVQEVEGLSPALAPSSPSLAVIAGAKFETKGPLIRKFIETYDNVFVGGALANDFFKAKSYETGRSLVSEVPPGIEDLLGNPKLHVPVDVVVGRGGERMMKRPDAVEADDYIYDAGPETAALLERLVGESAFVLWNGTLGQYEDGYTDGTERLAEILIASNARSVVGGGDTVTAIGRRRPEGNSSFVSTAGGAMLQFLLDGTLPGIEALKR